MAPPVPLEHGGLILRALRCNVPNVDAHVPAGHVTCMLDAVLCCADAAADAAARDARAISCCTCWWVQGHGGEGRDLPVLLHVALGLADVLHGKLALSATA